MRSSTKTNQALLTWDDTILKNEKTKTISTEEIKQLLITRGASNHDTKCKKSKLIKSLKQNYNVILTSIEDLSTKQLIVEIKLHGLSCRNARKQILIRRLKNGIMEKIAPRRWIHVNKSPLNCNSPIMMNKDEFIVTTSKGIFQYNIVENKWRKWINYPSKFLHKLKKPGSCHSCVNKKDNLIYTYDGTNGKLLKINYKKNAHTVFTHLPKVSDGFKCCFLHSQLHLIGGSGIRNNQHLIWDEQQKKFNKCFSFSAYPNGIQQFGLIHIMRKHVMLCIAGKSNEWYGDISRESTIYSYDTIKHKWKESKLGLPTGLSGFGCVVNKNEKYGLLFGGHDGYGYSNRIYVIDTEQMILMECNIHCPVKNVYDAIIMGNDVNEDSLVSGFARRCWNEYDIGLLFPPKYIIKLIQLWFAEEYVHLLEYTNHNHWIIPLCDILNNIK